MTTNTTIGSGLAGQIVAEDETAYGVAPTFASADTYEFKSESLKLKKATVQGQGLHGKVGTLPVYERTRRRVVTSYMAAGAITMDVPGNGLGFWLQAMIGSYGQALATPAELATSGVYKQVHQPGSLQGYSFSVQKGVPAVDGTVLPFTYTGCKVESWKLSCQVNQIAELALTIDARNELAGTGNGDPLNPSVPSLATPAYPAGMQLFHFREAVLSTGGTPTMTAGVCSLSGATAAGFCTKIEVDHAVILSKDRIFLGSAGFKSEQLESGFRKISGSLDVEFQSNEALYNSFAADTTTSLELTFTGPVIGTSGSNTMLLDVIIPNIKLEGEPPAIGGPGVVNVSIPFTGLDDEATTQIQFTYQSTDANL